MDREEKIRKMEERLARINAEIKRLKARASVEERKKDTRRKILVGGMVLAWAKETNEEAWLKNLLDKVLVRDNDRELFGLPPKKNKAEIEKTSVNLD